MFVVDDSTAAAIRRAYDEGGEFAAAVELRRHFPDITDTAAACRCARAIAGWGVPPVEEGRVGVGQNTSRAPTTVSTDARVIRSTLSGTRVAMWLPRTMPGREPQSSEINRGQFTEPSHQ
jgi:hypothetical protein